MTKTTPATAAAAMLAIRYAGAAGALAYLVGFASSRGLQPPAPPMVYAYVAALVLLALLWAWTAVCCWRRTPSTIVLGTIAITFVLVASGFVRLFTGDEPVEVLDVVEWIVDAVLLAIVIARFPRGATTAPTRAPLATRS